MESELLLTGDCMTELNKENQLWDRVRDGQCTGRHDLTVEFCQPAEICQRESTNPLLIL